MSDWTIICMAGGREFSYPDSPEVVRQEIEDARVLEPNKRVVKFCIPDEEREIYLDPSQVVMLWGIDCG